MLRVASLAAVVALLVLSTTTHVAESKSIAIIGAGFSGISAAYYLSTKGYDNITIYEKSNRHGGFISQVKYDNVTQDIATYAITPSYWKMQEATEAAYGQKWCLFSGDVALRDPDNPSDMATVQDSFEFFLEQSKAEKGGQMDDVTFIKNMLEQFARYNILWTRLMGLKIDLKNNFRTDRLFPTKPSADKLEELAKPTEQWMRDNNVAMLIPFFKLVTDTQAYGPISTTPLLYYMTWVPPTFLSQPLKVSVPCGPDTGMQQVATDLLHSINATTTVQYGVDVTSVTRGTDATNPTIELSNGLQLTDFDKVVVTAKLARLPFRDNIVTPLTAEEHAAEDAHLELELFGGAYKGAKSTSLSSSQVLLMDSPSVDYESTIEEFYLCVQHEWVDYPLAQYTYNSDPSNAIRTCSLFFYADRDSKTTVMLTEGEKTAKVLDHLRQWEPTSWNPLETRSYNGYFQRWDADGIKAGYPWTLESVQGQGGVYYVNSAACGFESLGNVFDCADHVIDQIVLDESKTVARGVFPPSRRMSRIEQVGRRCQ